LRPSLGSDVFSLPVGHRRQAGEDITEVGERIDTAKAATFDDGVEDGTTLTGLSFNKEEVIFPTCGSRADAVLGEVVVHFKATVIEIDTEFDPVGEGVVDCLGKGVGGPIPRGADRVGRGAKEYGPSWKAFLVQLKSRGMEGVELFISDKCLGLVENLSEFYPEARWQRCVVHFYRNVWTMGAFPDGQSALMLVAARLRHIAGTQWGTKPYLDISHLLRKENPAAKDAA